MAAEAAAEAAADGWMWVLLTKLNVRALLNSWEDFGSVIGSRAPERALTSAFRPQSCLRPAEWLPFSRWYWLAQAKLTLVSCIGRHGQVWMFRADPCHPNRVCRRTLEPCKVAQLGIECDAHLTLSVFATREVTFVP